MIEEKYLKMSISIRRTYLKLINNLDLYHNRALKVSSNLEETLVKLDGIQEGLDSKDKKTGGKETLDKILNILQEVEDEGKKLESLIDPINKEIEKLGREEQELYRQIVEHHPELTEDQIVNCVRDRLLKEGLS
jgi:type I site-specific restriction-modification system R (restriction) subunit